MNVPFFYVFVVQSCKWLPALALYMYVGNQTVLRGYLTPSQMTVAYVMLCTDRSNKTVAVDPKLVSAAKGAAKSLTGDERKTEAQLLSKLLNIFETAETQKKGAAPKSDEEDPLPKRDFKVSGIRLVFIILSFYSFHDFILS